MKKGEKKGKDALIEDGDKLTPPTSVVPTPKPSGIVGGTAKEAVPVKKLTGLKAEAVAKFPTDIVAQTKYILDNSEQVNFVVPLADSELPGAYETTQINGYRLVLRKGDMVKIPIQVAMLIAEKYKIAMNAGSEKRLDNASKETTDALG